MMEKKKKKLMARMAKMATWRKIMAKMAKMAKIFAIVAKKFRHYGKNGEKMFAISAIMAKTDGKMAKINGENDEFFSRHFRHFAMAKIEKKMANGNEPPN